MIAATTERWDHFRTNCLAWTVLHHFLPAELLREFSGALVDSASAGQLTLDQLFEERLPESLEALQSWVLRPLPVEPRLAQYLQYRIRYFVWASDAEVYFDTGNPAPGDPVTPKAIEDAVRLGHVDLSFPEQTFDPLKFPERQSIRTLVAALRAARKLTGSQNRAADLRAILDLCNSLDMPLAAVATKHIGDLSADSDEWLNALDFYKITLSLLSKYENEVWATYPNLLRSVTMQSLAAAIRVTQGAKLAAAFLSGELEKLKLETAPLALLNASVDALAAESVAAETISVAPDRRALISSAPLLLASHDLTSAFESWIADEHVNAQRLFWQVLRRQIALGSATASRQTKAFYAKSVFDGLDKNPERHHDPGLLRMGLRLLIESGEAGLAKRTPWSQKLVRAYINEEFVAAAIAHTNRIEASKDERIAVTIEIFRGWALALPAEHGSLAAQMLRFVVEAATAYKSSFFSQRNVGGRALEVLRDVADQRPEFRSGVASDLAPAVISKLRKEEFWTGIAEALKTGLLFLDVLQPSDIRSIIIATLSLLDTIDPANEVWVIVQPALDFLVSQDVQNLVKQDQQLAQRIVSTILRFGLNQQTEHTRLLFYIYQFDLGSMREEPMASQLREVVSDVRKQALTINASNAVDNIRALLLASAVSGHDGVTDALHAVTLILRTAFGQREPAISFSVLYEAFSILADRQQQIASDINAGIDDFRGKLYPIVDLITDIWRASVVRPALFAPFSFPPRAKPSFAIVHNWAFASLRLARSLGMQSKIVAVLNEAAANSELKDPIALAHATRLAAGELESFDASSIRLENAEPFYAAIGQRLVSVRQLSDPTRKQIMKALLDQCFRLGPRGIDAAVFLLAKEYELDDITENPEYSNYAKRLENNRELRLALLPILASLHSKGP